MFRLVFAGLLLLGAAGCDQVRIPGLESHNLDILPKGPNGQPQLVQGPFASLELNPFATDPITGLGACTDLATYCYFSGEHEGDLDTCVLNAPRCKTRLPWEEGSCCPEVCIKAYEGARKHKEPIEAFDQAFFEGGGCYPGVRELVVR